MLVPQIKMKSLMLLILTIFTLAPNVTAFWRLLCPGELGVARIDPIANYGEIAPHAHLAVGASNLGFSSAVEDLMASNCTSCSAIQDRSAYWAPALYFKHDNGSYELVKTQGGMTIYYFNDNNATVDEKLAAFPPGFRMVAGYTNLRDYPYAVPYPDMSEWTAEEMTQPALAAKSIGFNCLSHNPGFVTEGAMVYHYLRNKTFLDTHCSDGVRFEIQFPSCWDGVHIDSPEHNTHILYPPQLKTGPCPVGYTTRTPVMFYETIWQTNLFVDFSGQFVISNGDTEGYGYHADFFAGWNQTFLQQALDECTNSTGLQEDCHLFDLQSPGNCTSCLLDMPAELEDEDSIGPMPSLPGNVPIQTGPGNATKIPGTPLGEATSMPGGSTYSGSSTIGINTGAFSLNTKTSLPIAASTSSVGITPVTTLTPSSTCTTDDIQLISTTTFVSGGQDFVMVVYEQIVTVTGTTTTVTTIPQKRRMHKHETMHYQD